MRTSNYEETEIIVEPSIVDKIINEPSIVDEIIVEPSIVDEIIAEPSIVDEIIVEPSIVDEIIVEPSIVDEIIVEPSIVDEIIVEPSIVDEIIVEPSIVNEIIVEPSILDEINEMVEIVETEDITRIVECEVLASPTEVAVTVVDAYRAERWSDALVSPPLDEDTEPALTNAEPISEMYYTASSEVSLLSDGELPEKAVVENYGEDAAPQRQEKDKESEKGCVIAGHVAAMRERFESMTRENTPCSDLARSMSPSLDVLCNITSLPDSQE